MRIRWVVTALVLAGCKRTPPSDPGPGATSAAVPPAASSAPSVAAAPPPERPAVSGCFDAVRPLPSEPKAALAALSAACAPGFRPLGEAVRAADGNATVTVDVPDLACVRVIAVGAPGVRGFDAVLSDAKGRELGRDVLPGRFALVAEGGPICVRTGGTLSAKVRPRVGSGEALVQVLTAK